MTQRVLLDTHALLWWFTEDPRLPPTAASIFDPGRRNLVMVSAASAWEIATKVRLGKLPGVEELAIRFSEFLRSFGYVELPVSVVHAQRAGLLPGSHKDPFDRMLIAQALIEDVPLVSNEGLFDRYGVHRLW